MTCRLAGIGVGPAADDVWEPVGFRLAHGAIAVANGALLPGRHGLVVAGLHATATLDLDGIPVALGDAPAATDHPNGAFELDHLVLLTDSLERTSAAVEAVLDLECRRIRETDTVRQAFHRFDDVVDDQGRRTRGCIVELVERPTIERTSLMGVVFDVADLAGLAARLGPELVSEPKPAVQPGRMIATVRRGAGLPLPVALMTPEPAR